MSILGIIVSQYLQRVTPNFDMGAECTYHRGGHIPGGQAAFISLSARVQGKTNQTISVFLLDNVFLSHKCLIRTKLDFIL